MASSTGRLCGPCEARHTTTTAVSWCIDCDDGLCSSCLEDHKVNKASKTHQTIPVSQYVEIESVSSLIKQECEEHDQRLTFYCLDHYLTACALCVPEKHKQCTRLKPIDELARHAKTSIELCHQNAAKESVLELSTDPQLNNLLSDVKYFGTIHVVRNACQIENGAWEQPRAPLHLPITAVRDIDQTELELIREISFEDGTELRDCVIVNDGRMIFADFQRNKVLVYTRDGQLLKSISVDKSPFGLALINPHTVAVTCVEDKTINIVNIDESVAKQKINVGKPCSWLSFNNEKLYALVTNTGIMEFDLGGTLIKTIPVNVLSNDGYLSSYKDKFCYTCFNSLMTCCDSNGKTIWESRIANSGLAVDNYGNYFASKYFDRTLHIVSADGKRTKQLLTTENWKDCLEGVSFDKNSSTLLVACTSRNARLYRVK